MKKPYGKPTIELIPYSFEEHIAANSGAPSCTTIWLNAGPTSCTTGTPVPYKIDN